MEKCGRICTLLLVLIVMYSGINAQPATNTAKSIESKATDTTRTDPFFENLLKQYPQYFENILANRGANNVQVIYTTIDRGANGIASLKHHYFNVNPGHYFYPASAVKLPVALLALQRLNELKEKGIDKNTTMLTEKGYSGQTAVYNDPTTPDGKPSIAQYIRKMLMASDNDGYNRLYEFSGQQYINEQLQAKGYTEVQLLHRLEANRNDDENRHTNPVKFLAPGNTVLYQQPVQNSSFQYANRKDSIGKSFYSNGKLINTPMDFSNKNRVSLESLHTMLISLIFPNKVTSSQRFNISDEDRKFVLKYMSQLPTESIYPPYSDDLVNYYATQYKFLLYGAEKKMPLNNTRVFNKVGEAYGQLIDVAYVADFDKNIEFFLSAAIYCNSDGVLNDDKYDYDTIGLPFMKHLGEVIYEYETKREKKNVPDLSEVKFEYDRK